MEEPNLGKQASQKEEICASDTPCEGEYSHMGKGIQHRRKEEFNFQICGIFFKLGIWPISTEKEGKRAIPNPTSTQISFAVGF